MWDFRFMNAGRTLSRRHLLFSVAALLVGKSANMSPASALTPVTPEQILCAGDYIFAGKVTAVKNTDCRLSSTPSTCKQARTNDVQLTITVTRLMGARKTAQGLRVGQTLAAQSFTFTSPYNTTKFTDQGMLAFRANYDELLPEAWLHAAYVGQEFVFSGSPTSKPPRVMVWPVDQADWARNAMTQPEKLYGGDCAVPL